MGRAALVSCQPGPVISESGDARLSKSLNGHLAPQKLKVASKTKYGIPKATTIVAKNSAHDHCVKNMTLFENRDAKKRPHKTVHITSTD